jgi:CheY-like chemotaxis protein
MMSRVLADLPVRIITAIDGETALQVAASDPPDLVVSDVRLPGIDGIKLTELLKLERPALPVLLVSAYGEPNAHSGDGFIAKPFDNDLLVAAVKRCLESQASTDVARPGAWPFTLWFGEPES